MRQSHSSIENNNNLQETEKPLFDLHELEIVEDERIANNVISVRSFKSDELALLGIKNDDI